MTDPITIVVALMTGVVAMLALVGWKGIGIRSPPLAEWTVSPRPPNTPQTAPERPPSPPEMDALAANRSADACIAMAEQVNVLIQHFIRRQQPGPAE
jgi:hypothetical protein